MSTFINSFRKIPNASDPEWAQTGDDGETTLEATCYEYMDQIHIQICDLPGGGTKRFPAETYAEDMGLRYFDHVILLYHNRFTETDTHILKDVKDRDIPHSVARSQSRSLFEKAARRGKSIAEIKKNVSDKFYHDHGEHIFFVDANYNDDGIFDENHNADLVSFLDEKALYTNIICQLLWMRGGWNMGSIAHKIYDTVCI